MVDYAKLYYILCAAASAALDALPVSAETAAARRLLEEALNEAEEIYIESSE